MNRIYLPAYNKQSTLTELHFLETTRLYRFTIKEKSQLLSTSSDTLPCFSKESKALLKANYIEISHVMQNKVFHPFFDKRARNTRPKYPWNQTNIVS